MFETLKEFFQWLATGPGALVAAGVFVSYVLSKLEVWNKLSHDVKVAGSLALAVGISFAAKEFIALGLYGNEYLLQAFSVLVYYFANQASYLKFFEKSKSKAA